MGQAHHTAQGHRWGTTAGEGGEMPVVLKRWSVPTGEPENTERVPSGSVGGRGKRSVSSRARGLPNLLRRCGYRQRLRPGVRPISRSDRVMPIMFNTILREVGLPLTDVRLIRHKDKRATRGRTPYELWRDNRP